MSEPIDLEVLALTPDQIRRMDLTGYTVIRKTELRAARKVVEAWKESRRLLMEAVGPFVPEPYGTEFISLILNRTKWFEWTGVNRKGDAALADYEASK